MLQFIPVFEDNTFVVRATGNLTHEDYQAFLPQLEEQFKDHDKISLLLELDNFTGWDWEAAKDDFKLGIKHFDDFERIAIVGDKVWEHWMVLMAKPFMIGGEVRYYDRENLQNSWDWLREKQNLEKSLEKNLEKSAEQLSPYQNILCAIDFSIYSKHAVKRAIEVADLYNANLTLLHVTHEIDPYQYYPGDFILAGSSQPYDFTIIEKQNKQLRKIAAEHMQALLASINTDMSIHTEVTSGEKKATILSYLEAQNTDLVIFGSRKKKGMEKLHGSTAQYIHNHARCEILVSPLEDLAKFEIV